MSGISKQVQYIFDGKRFTKRERDVWLLSVSSEKTEGIAHSLGISSRTVEWHRTQIYRKLHINDIAALTRAAIRVGLIAP